MSPFPQGSPCYALVWEGAIGAFYEIDPDLNITLIADVMNEPGNRYISIYGLADPTFPKNAPFSRFSDAGKLMALASFAQRSTPTAEEEELMTFLLSSEHVRLDLYDRLESSRVFQRRQDDTEFRNFAGIFSDRIFETFHRFARDQHAQGSAVGHRRRLRTELRLEHEVEGDRYLLRCLRATCCQRLRFGNRDGDRRPAPLHRRCQDRVGCLFRLAIQSRIRSSLRPLRRPRCELRGGGPHAEQRPNPRLGQRQVRDRSSRSRQSVHPRRAIR